MFKKILLPVDWFDPERYRMAIAAVRELAIKGKTEVRVMTVAPSDENFMSNYSFKTEMARIAADMQIKVEAIAAEFRDLKSAADGVVRIGKVHDEVLKQAQEWGADLIVIGSHNPAMSTYLLGSNASRIVRHAKCSVLVLRGSD